MFCHSCGTETGPHVRFCPNCGQALAAPPAAYALTPVAWTPPSGVKAQTGRWIGQGWEMVKSDLGSYVLIAVVVIALNGAVPLILQGPLAVGFHLFCIKKMLHRPAGVGDIFKGFNFFAPALVASLAISLFVFGGSLLCIIPGLVLAAMYKFTYLFILDKRMEFWPAMQASHAVVKNDYFGFTMFLLALVAVNVLGALCCLVGLLVTTPLTVAAITAAYREVVGFEPQTLATL